VIPDTKNGLPAMVCVSAMQKCIRRDMEREAMELACELMQTSKALVPPVAKDGYEDEAYRMLVLRAAQRATT
jgi:hypothetical protein